MENATATPEKRLRTGRSGSGNSARKLLWHAMRRTNDVLANPDSSVSQIIAATHALSQACGTYFKFVEGEFDKRLQVLEAIVKDRHE